MIGPLAGHIPPPLAPLARHGAHGLHHGGGHRRACQVPADGRLPPAVRHRLPPPAAATRAHRRRARVRASGHGAAGGARGACTTAKTLTQKRRKRYCTIFKKMKRGAHVGQKAASGFGAVTRNSVRVHFGEWHRRTLGPNEHNREELLIGLVQSPGIIPLPSRYWPGGEPERDAAAPPGGWRVGRGGRPAASVSTPLAAALSRPGET
eukprot:1180018-Prorocentrum_minimum.AAC.2